MAWGRLRSCGPLVASSGPAVREAAAPPGGWRHPGSAWTVRYGGAVGVGWTVSGLLFGAALGGVYALITGDWRNGTTWGELWLTVGLAVVAVLIGAWCLTAVVGRARLTRRNGTAYILREQARGWDRDDAARFLAESRRQFARVIQVPGRPSWTAAGAGDSMRRQGGGTPRSPSWPSPSGRCTWTTTRPALAGSSCGRGGQSRWRSACASRPPSAGLS